MHDPLAGIEAKLQRGDHHLERIEMEVAAFLYSKPWKVAFERDRDRGLHWQVASFVIERHPPTGWSIRVGEAVHQYRASLDHLMTDLSRLRRPKLRVDKSPNFPICPSPGQFWAKKADTGHIPATSIKRAVRLEHFAELERLQPKKPEDLHGSGELSAPMALAVLRWIDDLDKHATVRPGFIAPKSIHYNSLWSIGNYGDIVIGATDPDFEEIYRAFDPLDDGAQLYRARFRIPSRTQMNVPMTIEPDVNFGMAPYEWVTLEVIRGCFIWVRRIIERFREITPEFQIGAHLERPSS